MTSDEIVTALLGALRVAREQLIVYDDLCPRGGENVDLVDALELVDDAIALVDDDIIEPDMATIW